ncbi:hypothetical protein Glove_51g63 [Diversispora epigaea]|uniref:Nodulin-like domain-containing protein n=1 Tax=Diversispora epigaea TaxID=1348612 RepID=A0A397JML6_9GLOM|nr:hypothetical protein Glove_51g63 [Diversispora epigaea]
MSSRVTKLTLSYLSTLLISSVCGTQYLFSAYSTAIQDRLGFTSVQINTIGSFANYGVFLSKPFFGYISDNHGSQRICVAASFLMFISYLCLALTYQQILPSSSFMLCALYLFCAGIASAGGMVSSMVTVTKNFTSLRGTALGVPIALFGLSAFMYSQINMHFFQNDTFHFILFISTSAGICLFIGSWFLVVVPPPLPTTTVGGSINEFEEGISNSHHDKIDKIDRIDKIEDDNNNNSNLFTEQTPLLLQQKKCKNEQYIKPNIIIENENEELDIGGWELVHNNDAIRLVLIMVFIGGVGLMYINNVGAIIKSLYYAPSTQPSHSLHPSHPFHLIHPSFKDLNNNNAEIQRLQNLHVSLLSIFSFLGRISGGFLSDLAKHFYDIPRISFLGLAALWLLIGQMLILFWIQQVDNLWMVTCFVGYGFGIQYGIAPTITGELFGSKRFGLNWGLLACFPAVGGQIFNLLFGYNSDLHRDHCSGAECYSSVFYISSIGCLISILVTFYMLLLEKNKSTNKFIIQSIK